MKPAAKKPKVTKDTVPIPDKIFEGFTVFILPAGIAKMRCEVFKKQLIKYGATVKNKFDSEVISHVILDENMDAERLQKILKLPSLPDKVTFVKSLWLSNCIKQKQLLDTAEYVLEVPEPTENAHDEDKPAHAQSEDVVRAPETAAVALNRADSADSDYVASDSEPEHVAHVEQVATTSKKWKPNPESWVCAHSSKTGNQHVNHNKHITDKLETLARAYENVKDRWRALGYQKAIISLKKHPKPITTFEEAKALRGVGSRLAEKIWEIVESGDLQKVHEVAETEEVKVIELFTNIWGAGATTARQWYMAGYRTLDDIRDKATLTRQQKVGLTHYDDLLDRMPREEAGLIEETDTCGDVDVLVTHPDGKSHKGIFQPLLNKLHSTGFLTDDLVSQEDNGSQRKYLGVCRLPGPDRRHRRLDIIVVPYSEYACALMYFTGSAHFNRSMRHLAGKMGMSLSEHSLNTGVIRKAGEKLNPGVPLSTPTEQSVFEHLGLKYRPPEERNH